MTAKGPPGLRVNMHLHLTTSSCARDLFSLESIRVLPLINKIAELEVEGSKAVERGSSESKSTQGRQF